jgi:hypothetical protein
LIAHRCHLLTGVLDFANDDLEPLKVAHESHGGEAPQERRGPDTTSSAAMSERRAVFITALKSLILASPKVHESTSGAC